MQGATDEPKVGSTGELECFHVSKGGSHGPHRQSRSLIERNKGPSTPALRASAQDDTVVRDGYTSCKQEACMGAAAEETLGPQSQ